jgi:hypothetical protein
MNAFKDNPVTSSTRIKSVYLELSTGEPYQEQ